MKKFLPFILLCISFIGFTQNLSNDNFEFEEMYSEMNTNNSAFNTEKKTSQNQSTRASNNEVFTSMQLKKRLEILNAKTPFEVPYNATVERFIRLYLKDNKEAISNLMDRANYYFPIFEEYLDKYDIPLEIKYLAVVESALLPTATSHAGAKGIWQFMYHTGKEYGLEVTSYIDERNDPLKATEAACKFLKHLYDRFGDWDLALAAYNSGAGNVNKAIRRSGGKRNYWNIRKHLPKETSSYVPAFYATLYLFEFGEAHQIYPNNIEIDYFDTDTIHINKKLSFTQIEKITGVSKAFLTSLNPQYKLSVIPYYKNQSFVLTLPKNAIEKFLNRNFEDESEQENKEKPLHLIATVENSYVVQNLDNLPKIAKKYGITLQQLKEWNGLQSNFLIKGQRLVITNKKNEIAIETTTRPIQPKTISATPSVF